MNNTLINYHKNKLSEYDDKKKNINEHSKKIDENLEKIKELKTLEKNSVNVNIIYDLEMEIEELELEIKNIKNLEKEYYMNNFNNLTKYFLKTDEKKNKKEIFSEYLENVDDNYIGEESFIDNKNICSNCENPMNIDVFLSKYICSECGLTMEVILENQKVQYSNSITENKYNYKRITHFIDWLNKIDITNNENKIPINVYSKIMNVKNEKYGLSTELSLDRLKYILTNLKLKKYMKYADTILNKINNKK